MATEPTGGGEASSCAGREGEDGVWLPFSATDGAGRLLAETTPRPPVPKRGGGSRTNPPLPTKEGHTFSSPPPLAEGPHSAFATSSGSRRYLTGRRATLNVWL